MAIHAGVYQHLSRLTCREQQSLRMKCRTCHRKLSFAHYLRNVGGRSSNFGGTFTCLCGERMIPGNHMMRAAPYSVQHCHNNNVAGLSLDGYWYHASTMQNWLSVCKSNERIQGNVFVHVGSKFAALERANVLLKETRKRVYLHCVQPSRRLVLSHTLGRDEDDNDEFIKQRNGEWRGTQQCNAFAYLNAYECPGSVSLMVTPSALAYPTVVTHYSRDYS